MIHTFSSTFSYVCSQIQPQCCIEEIYNVGSYLDILKQLEPGKRGTVGFCLAFYQSIEACDYNILRILFVRILIVYLTECFYHV
jgi:hypothetical protein